MDRGRRNSLKLWDRRATDSLKLFQRFWWEGTLGEMPVLCLSPPGGEVVAFDGVVVCCCEGGEVEEGEGGEGAVVGG